MRFGLSLVSEHRHRPPVDAYEAMLEQATVAEASGFDAVFVSEHHPAPGMGGYCLQPVPVLAALAVAARPSHPITSTTRKPMVSEAMSGP